MRLPFDGDFRVVSPFGPRAGGFHPGIDYNLPTGTPVVAVDDGIITHAGADGGAGNHVVLLLDHPPDNVPKVGYMHLRDFAVHPGDRVVSGQVLGWSDSTGNSTGPHLHFWAGRSGVDAVDPQPFLDEGGAAPFPDLSFLLDGATMPVIISSPSGERLLEWPLFTGVTSTDLASLRAKNVATIHTSEDVANTLVAASTNFLKQYAP